MFRTIGRITLSTASVVALASVTAMAGDAQIKRDEYLVTVGECNDYHTPGYFFGKSDISRFLTVRMSASRKGQGVFVGCNITPDKETGIGSWTAEQIVTAIQTGERPDGRILAHAMPWHAFAQLTADDAMAIAAFLQSVKPVYNEVSEPFRPEEKVSSFMLRIMPPGETQPPRRNRPVRPGRD